MAKILPLTQFNILKHIGYYPNINEIATIKDYGGDSDICYTVETTREFNIEMQNNQEYWYNLRNEFWPEEM